MQLHEVHTIKVGHSMRSLHHGQVDKMDFNLDFNLSPIESGSKTIGFDQFIELPSPDVTEESYIKSSTPLQLTNSK